MLLFNGDGFKVKIKFVYIFTGTYLSINCLNTIAKTARLRILT